MRFLSSGQEKHPQSVPVRPQGSIPTLHWDVGGKFVMIALKSPVVSSYSVSLWKSATVGFFLSIFFKDTQR